MRHLVGGLPEFSCIQYGTGGNGEGLEYADISNKLKLFNLGGISEEKLEEEISKVLRKDINSLSTINYINSLYDEQSKCIKKFFS